MKDPPVTLHLLLKIHKKFVVGSHFYSHNLKITVRQLSIDYLDKKIHLSCKNVTQHVSLALFYYCDQRVRRQVLLGISVGTISVNLFPWAYAHLHLLCLVELKSECEDYTATSADEERVFDGDEVSYGKRVSKTPKKLASYVSGESIKSQL